MVELFGKPAFQLQKKHTGFLRVFHKSTQDDAVRWCAKVVHMLPPATLSQLGSYGSEKRLRKKGK
jgi:hypothetical protein